MKCLELYHSFAEALVLGTRHYHREMLLQNRDRFELLRDYQTRVYAFQETLEVRHVRELCSLSVSVEVLAVGSLDADNFSKHDSVFGFYPGKTLLLSDPLLQ